MNHPELFAATYPEDVYQIPSGTVVVLNKPWSDISDSERNLLEKILNSVKLSLNHVTIVFSLKPDVASWVNRPQNVVAFGTEIIGLQKNEMMEVQGVKLVATASLEELESDAESKKKLWGALRQIFDE